jgi:hypothetical protein
MPKIECTKSQLRLIQTALDFYSRVGMGQFNVIVEHPTFEKSLYRQFSPNTPLKVGDQTLRGEITKITKTAIWTKGSWSNGEEIRKWTDLENIKLSPDWSAFHAKEDEVKNQLNIARNLLYGEEMVRNGSWGIYNKNGDESCREAFSIIEKIRHQFWLVNPNRSSATVDSTDGRLENVKVTLDE